LGLAPGAQLSEVCQDALLNGLDRRVVVDAQTSHIRLTRRTHRRRHFGWQLKSISGSSAVANGENGDDGSSNATPGDGEWLQHGTLRFDCEAPA